MKLAWKVLLTLTRSPSLSKLASRYSTKVHHIRPIFTVAVRTPTLVQVQARREFHFTIKMSAQSTLSKQDLKSLENITLIEHTEANHGALQNGTRADGVEHAEEEPVKQVAETAQNAVSRAILRYQEGTDQYQLTCSFHNKTFNFARLASEPISSLYDRMIKNISKKVKHFEENVHLRLGDNVLDPSESILVILEKFDWQNTAETVLSLQIDNENLRIEINPPEVFKIKFFKSGMVGFPVLPDKLEGSPNFNPKLSKYMWESGKLTAKQTVEVSVGKKLSASRRNSWSECSDVSGASNSVVFIPDESLIGKRLRFTCTPTSDGHKFGQPLSEETPFILAAPPTTKFVFNERLNRLDSKPSTDSSACPGFLRVISYNTLADTYATKEWFSSSPEESLLSEYRLPILCHELKMYQGDFICLQEVDDKYYERFYEPFLSHCGLKGYFSCKTDGTKEGIAMFYNSEKFHAVELLTVAIGEHMKTLDFYNNKLQNYPAIIDTLHERNTVLQVAVLESVLVPDTILVVANTHLYFHPTADHIRTLQTLTNLDFLEAKLKNLKTLHPNKSVHVLFCGDFNCTPPYGSFRAITTGRIEESDFDWTSHETEKMSPGVSFSHNLNLINTHPDHELTNIVKNFEGCLDYIFYQQSMKLLKTYPPPSKATIAEICGIEESKLSLPNFQAPSDHVPLIADFSL